MNAYSSSPSFSPSPLIRTFRARDARAALTAVKEAFGADAVIIETKQIGGGIFGHARTRASICSGEASRSAP